MRFLSDQDVWQATVDFIRAAGYEVQRAAEAGLAQASDEQLLEYARRKGRVLLTRHKGFGSLVFVKQREHKGVILLRVTPEALEAVHRELRAFIAEHGQEDLSGCFVVIEPGRHRLRRVPS
jgi:predicted nuclease of predicted toxin-antitoxin system